MTPEHMEVTTQHREIAVKLLQVVMYDSGMVNILEPEKYPLAAVQDLAAAVAKALEAEPNLEFSDEVIETLAAGEYSELHALINSYDSLKPVDEIISKFFDGDYD